MKLLPTMRTANRYPKENYLFQTIESLRRQGVAGSDIHVFPTDPDVRWLEHRIPYQAMTVHAPTERRRANANGLAPIALLDTMPADWIILSEDDLQWCADPLGSMARWLEVHARPDVLVYRFFAFDALTRASRYAAEAPLREMRGSQAVALRTADARRFAKWAREHPLTWRPKGAPFQDRPHDGFDKLIGYWALAERPDVTTGLVSRPFFVKHIGVQSSLHGHGRRMDQHFIGADRAYQSEAVWP